MRSRMLGASIGNTLVEQTTRRVGIERLNLELR
jgi:hypothetical protein